ncbi:GDSL esterase/lipase [Artemisia annua]|uniref:GDSL esterase/lipase n=1 Tax=Artemisia annua TaxID=35608 RepID=A0A2U1M413_ARTAN|nr:GDSL esterase/lipase [Artemisia annua]
MDSSLASLLTLLIFSHIIFSNIEPVASVHVSGDLCTKSRNSSLSSPRRGPAAALAPVPALFVIGDSSVDCGTNNFLGTLARADHAPYGRDFDTHQPTGRFSNGRIPVDYLALHLKLPFIPSYLGQSGSTEDMKQGLNYASAGAGIIFSSGSELGQHISFTQQIEQVMDTFQRFTLTMGETEAANLISDSVFYISIGTNDYIHYYLPDVSSVQSKYVSWNFTKFLARTMKEEIKVKSSDNEFWVERICVVAAVCLPVLIRFVYFKIRPLLKSLPDTKGSSWVEEIFKKVAEDGAKFCGCTTLALIGVGHGAKLLESSPTSTAYIGLLSIAGFFGFSFAQLASPGWIFRSFSVFGFIAHTAIIVICSLHRTVRNEYEFLIVLGSVLYVLLCVWGKWMLVTNTIEANAKAKAQLEATTTTEDEAVKEGDAKALEDEEKRLNQIAKDGVAFTTLGGLALFCVGEWGAFVESFPIAFTLLATYNVMTFSCLYAARFLERGIFFDILLLVGSVFGMMMIPTSVGLLLLPGYDFPIMLLTILSVTLVKWDRIDAAIEWVLDRCS